MNQIYRDLQDALDDGTTIAEYRKQRSSHQEAQAFDRIKEMCEDILSALNDMRYYYVEIGEEGDDDDDGDDDDE